MGMRQRRCPQCKKRRRYVEGAQKGASGRSDGWSFDGDKMVCRQCSAKGEAADQAGVETLIYNEDGCAWVRTNRFGANGDLSSVANPKAVFPTLMHAYQEAARRGYRPTHWARPKVGVYPLDQADHWRRIAGIEVKPMTSEQEIEQALADWREGEVESMERLAGIAREAIRKRDEAQANYEWMVRRAAVGADGGPGLGAYREIGQRAADAERERDNAQATLAAERERSRRLVEAMRGLADYCKSEADAYADIGADIESALSEYEGGQTDGER